MKWYWAILITFGLFTLPVMMLMNGANEKSVDALIWILVGISALYAGVNSGSFGWGIFVFLFWPIAFPAFFIFAKPASHESISPKPDSPDSQNREAHGEEEVYREFNGPNRD